MNDAHDTPRPAEKAKRLPRKKERELIAAHKAMTPRGVRLSTDCAVHVHRDWVPTNDHHVWPKGMGGPDTKANKVRVCMNGHGEIHAYLDLLIKYGEGDEADFDERGGVPWEQAQHFGPQVRHYAFLGWTQAGRPRSGLSGE